MKILKLFLGIGLIGVVCIAVASYVSPRFFVKTAYTLVKLEFDDLPEFSNHVLLDLSNAQRENYIVVDVRSPVERNISIIQGSIDQAYFEQNFDSYQNKKVVVYCTIGYRSGYYAKALRQQGLDAYNLSEGILGWIQAGGSLVNADGQITSKVHVYSRPWDLAVKDHVAVF
jgi:rhodanese-related sulfurtransferase